MDNKPVSIIEIPDILLPNDSVDMQKWAVIACDQYTSQKSYWDQVEAFVGDDPSTLHITYPEYYLGKIDEKEKIASIQNAMNQYTRDGIFTSHKGMILVERQIDAGIRYGIMMSIDLEDYDFSKTSTSWIRATEGTVAERIPPRVKIRMGAPLELPHILVLVDDDRKQLIEPLVARKGEMKVLYDFDLMMDSGHVRGYSLANPEFENHILNFISNAQSDEAIEKKYGAANDKNRILFAIGDGNHSLATAKTIWEEHKKEWGMNHPARYAMVEIENLHDDAMMFEPIHRAVFGVEKSMLSAIQEKFGDKIEVVPMVSLDAMTAEINATPDGVESFGLIEGGCAWKITFKDPVSVLCVGSIQQMLDDMKKAGVFVEVDYIHGAQDLIEVSEGEHKAGFYLPPVQKNGFFQGIIRDGTLPRKTFSMGEAHEKRFYIEGRRIL